MNIPDSVLVINSLNGLQKILKILDHIKKFPSKEGELAKKAFNRVLLVTLVIITTVLGPLTIYSMVLLEKESNPVYPPGATKEVRGFISKYEDTFWYTDSSQKYEFAISDYSLDDSYKHGQSILIYIDDDNQIISVSHLKDDSKAGYVVILAIFLPVILSIAFYFIGKKTYAKWWYKYQLWYEKEILPYCYQDNFEEIKASKKFYEVEANFKSMDLINQNLYKKYKRLEILYSLLLVLCAAITIYLTGIYENTIIIWGILVIIIFVLLFLIDKYHKKSVEAKFVDLQKGEKKE